MDRDNSPSLSARDEPRHVVRNLLFGVAFFLALEAAIFRTGFYAQWLAPESYAGRVHHFVEWTANHTARGECDIALFGDSRLAEGFSAKIADALYGPQGVRFFNFGTPGASLRVQYYLLRQVDPQANRFRTIAIGLDNYDDLSTSEDLSDRAMDFRFITELLHYDDLFDFPSSFSSSHEQNDAAATCLLKGHGYKLDLQDLLQAPLPRIRLANSLKGSSFDWAYEYEGRDTSLAGIEFDGSQLKFPPGASPQLIAEVQGRLEEVHRVPFNNSAYRRQWLARIVDRYRDSKTRLVILQMPRGAFNWNPAHRPDTSTIDWLRATRDVAILDQHLFDSLEQPQLFGDSLHLNHDGRQAFSKKCAATLVELSKAKAQQGIRASPAEQSLWVEMGAGRYEALLEPAAPHPPLGDGFYDRGAGVNNVKPDFWLTLPPAHGAGVLKLTGYMHPLLARILPLTITAKSDAAEPVTTVIAKDGFFEFTVPCAAPEAAAGSSPPDRISFTVDKTITPKSAGINDDERALSIGIFKIEYLPAPAGK